MPNVFLDRASNLKPMPKKYKYDSTRSHTYIFNIFLSMYVFEVGANSDQRWLVEIPILKLRLLSIVYFSQLEMHEFEQRDLEFIK